MNEKLLQEYGEVEKIRIHDDGDPIVHRPSEVAAVDAMVNPDLPEPFPEWRIQEQLVDDMKARGFVWCNGRCQDFKHKSEFAMDERNPGRLYCQSYCKECMAARDHRKRVALLSRDAQAQQRYEYKARKPKKK